MRGLSGLCFTLTLLSCVVTSPQQQLCNDCTDYGFCETARNLLRQGTPASDEKLQSAFCGFNQAGLPKICCSKLSTANTMPSSNEVEGHPKLALLPENCGETDSDKIIGGKNTGLYQYPWMVLLSYQKLNGLSFDCGGTLITDRYVLTAAHCVVGRQLVGVRVGEHDIDTDIDCQGVPPQQTCESHIQDIRIQSIIPHPSFATNRQHDIALLRLKKKVDLTHRNAGLVCLPVTREQQTREIVGLNATVAGWGQTETGHKSSKLLAVDVPVTDNESCALLFNRQGGENYKICAGWKELDSCNGDSGGPLMLKGFHRRAGRLFEYGIVSTGPPNCGKGAPGSYTNVAKHMKWILDNIEW
ncbi:CLIP domain-containing serine protease HP8-like [Choristoneura fumiferana]|uniref:CLIP domain-containing serine protease HP8-like n=1 Tax=Choristoneura fumiferana TaxID=7141 RepID=UPI003D15542E